MKKQRFLRILMIAMLFLMVSSVSNLHAGDCDECNKQKAGGATGTGIYNRTKIDCIAAPTDMAWDSDNSVQTLSRSDSGTIAVTGNNGPFTWSVSTGGYPTGQGFVLDNETTEGNTNTINTLSYACGSATITVTGCDGTVVTGGVRCTTGRWVSYSSGECEYSQEAVVNEYLGYAYGKYTFRATQGRYRTTFLARTWGGDGDCNYSYPYCYFFISEENQSPGHCAKLLPQTGHEWCDCWHPTTDPLTSTYWGIERIDTERWKCP